MFVTVTGCVAIVIVGVWRASEPVKVRVMVSPALAKLELALVVVTVIPLRVGAVLSKVIDEVLLTVVPTLEAKS